jgi:hypothetical protein
MAVAMGRKFATGTALVRGHDQDGIYQVADLYRIEKWHENYPLIESKTKL